ncbi:g4557 [Coccomyxa viridis]|uniref:G4557 protein n=1 Tax=Coccomyxa viridis TaxID=1274662 RepID=A0ABP1FSV0_9CHLO
MASDPFKANGNAAFAAGNHEEAIKHFTEGIAVDPSNHVLYSNRSASYASLQQYEEALTDAEKVVELKPDWPKGYSRLGAAAIGLGDTEQAKAAYEKGLEVDPANEGFKTELENLKRPPRSAGGGFFGPEILGKLALNPATAPLLSQPDFIHMIQDVNKNPNNMSKYLGDDRFQQALQVGLGMNVMGGDEFKRRHQGDASAHASSSSTATPQPKPAPKPKEPEPEPEPTPMEEEPVDEAEKALREQKADAQKAKEAGNAAYKARQFEKAVEHYDHAIKLDDSDISFLTNRAAVYLEMGEYEKCIVDCDTAVEKGRDIRADYKVIARALTRKANALAKQERYEEAVETYHKSLTEHRNADTLKRLQETEKKLKEQQTKAYISMDISNEEREKGNQAFNEQKYPEAVKHYTEALARGPPEVNPDAHKLFSNRAACYTKLGAWNEGLKDAEQCIALEPTFIKGYIRKGHLQFFMKEYEKAAETYEAGLQQDPNNLELKDGIARCMEAVNKINRGDISEDELAVRREKAMADPNIQNILTDPVMRQVLQDFQEDPQGAQRHTRSPMIMEKLQKLINAGIVRQGP